MTSCGQGGEFERSVVAPPPPAVMLTSALESLSLDQKLELLEEELEVGASYGTMSDEAIGHLFRAEAITDRLLESRLPYKWLAEGYDLEARVRQIQSKADLMVALIRRGADESDILAEVSDLRRQVAALRAALREPGGDPPLPLEVLLRSVPADSLRGMVSEGTEE